MGAATGWTSLCSSRWGSHAGEWSWPLSPSRAVSFWSSSGVMAIMRSSAVNSSRPVANFSVGADRQAGFALLGEYDLRGELQLLQPDGGGAHVDGDDSSVGSLRGERPFDGHTQPLLQLPGGCGARWSRCPPWPRDSQSIIPAGRRRRWRSPGTRRIRSAPAPAAMVPGSHQDVIGQLEVTANVVVVIGIYIYYYYYDSGHSQLPHGWRQAKGNAAGRCRRHSAWADCRGATRRGIW